MKYFFFLSGLYKYDWFAINTDFFSALINIHLGKLHMLRQSGLLYLFQVGFYALFKTNHLVFTIPLIKTKK